MMKDSKRRLMYNKRLAPNSFVFFFHNGPGETSWSVRDYSLPGAVRLRYAPDFQDAAGRIPLASEIRAESQYDFPTPAHPTTDIEHWHSVIAAKNAEYLAEQGAAVASPVATSQIPPVDGTLSLSFPILNLAKLMSSPKARKRGDIERILHSKNSEDYVTWNFFQLLDSVPAACWWPALLKLTGVSSLDEADLPTVRLWQTAAAPRDYEALSRERMRVSSNLAWRKRSLDMGPVEGPSEIDITFEGRDYIVFVEAKLGSDISFTTTYDPERNQIARNIDCALEACGKRRPVFWMFVRDRQPTRAYVQLMARYQMAPEISRSLPHRAMSGLSEVASTLAVVTWSELLTLLAGANRVGIELEVEQELRRRAAFS
jgi:hypothetical protein